MKDVKAVILAGGLGTRMKSDIPKALQELHCKPILEFLIHTLDDVDIKDKVLVINPKDSVIKDRYNELDIVIQDDPLGSGDALKRTKDYFKDFKGNILVMCCDTPLISSDSIKSLIKTHKEDKPSCTLLTARLTDPTGYGRIVRGSNENVAKIIEQKDLSVYEEAIEEVNVGCYCFNKEDLFNYIDRIELNPKKKEYYLTDIIGILVKNNKKIMAVSCKDRDEALGINSKVDLAEANDILRRRALEKLMLEGVTILEPKTTCVHIETKVGKDTVIYPKTYIENDVEIGKNCKIGPFARIRKGTKLDDDVEIGNFVEISRTEVKSGTKIKHKTYIGDAHIGKNVNVGAGTITANYDGKNKNKTIIEDGAFIGVGSILIAPVKIGSGAIVGAGSVVTKNHDVPKGKTVVGIPAKILKKGKSHGK